MHASGAPLDWIRPLRDRRWSRRARGRPAFIPLATKLVLSYLLVVSITAVVFGVVGTRVIGNLIMSEARSTVRNDLNAAREILQGRLNHVGYVVRFTADRYILLQDALVARRPERVQEALVRIREREGLDFLTLSDASGVVLLRTSNGEQIGDTVVDDEVLQVAHATRAPVASVALMTSEALRRESPALAERARMTLFPTPMARPRAETEEMSGMVLKAAAPILDRHGTVLGILTGGILLNRNFAIVDKVKETVFEGVQYRGRDIGTATIFQDDVRIATNVTNPDGSRAIGTRVAEEVYRRVVLEGGQWLGRAYVVKDWYITAYEPIRGLNETILGILYVGVLEEKFLDIRARTVLGFLAIMLGGALLAVVFSAAITRRVSGSVRRLVSAARELAGGNLHARVDIRTNDELATLADSFNGMAAALRDRDDRLREFARKRIMESERLAVVGQLAAGVAHELNNPLQGILTYSHVLLERTTAADPAREGLEKITAQAERCRETIRSLLDFSRPRKPHVRPSSITAILRECLSLLERHALFHNIDIAVDAVPDLPSATVDPAQVQQVFMNLIINAAEAMEGAGRLELVTRFDVAERMVEARVTDTGPGIRPEDLDRVFDPFFTTKGVGHGTGLGLSISYGIVKEHRGTITVESTVGAGTTFTVRFPASPEEGPA